MSDTWGKGAKNNTIGWGSAACTTTNDWGKSQKDSSVAASWSGDTDISGCAGAVLSITYSSSNFCTNATDPIPTVTDNVGAGTFSSTTGLVFVSTTTGEVDISNTVTGTYVITYTDTDAATATFTLTLNALDNAAFSYSASSYDPSASNPTPTITGLAGGTFSAGSGLVFVDSGSNTGSSTGEINLSASTIASYTITYDTASSGSSVCPNTSTQTVEIAAALAQVNNVYSMEFDGLDSSLSLSGDTTFWGNGETAFSYSTWVKFNSFGTQDGLITKRIDTNNRVTIKLGLTSPYKNIMVFMANGTSNYIEFLNTFSSTDVWYHLVVTYDGTQTVSDRVVAYVNGVDMGTPSGGSLGTIPSTMPSLGSTPIIFGDDTQASARHLDGFLDEAAIFDTVLTAQEVQNIYNATETGKTADLNDLTTPPVKWYRMGD